jgi:regulatory protein
LDAKKPPGRAPRTRGPLTLAGLEKAALDYLGRFASSRASLRRVLGRRVARAARDGRIDAAEGARLIEDIIARYAASGLVDDAAYAAQQAASLQRRGASAQAIRARLAQKGVEPEAVRAALASREAEGGGDLAAACALVRRRRLGPYRPPASRAAARAKDLGVLARAGFSGDVARRVLGAADADALDRLGRADC